MAGIHNISAQGNRRISLAQKPSAQSRASSTKGPCQRVYGIPVPGLCREAPKSLHKDFLQEPTGFLHDTRTFFKTCRKISAEGSLKTSHWIFELTRSRHKDLKNETAGSLHKSPVMELTKSLYKDPLPLTDGMFGQGSSEGILCIFRILMEGPSMSR